MFVLVDGKWVQMQPMEVRETHLKLTLSLLVMVACLMVACLMHLVILT